MDPNQALADMIQACVENDLERAGELYDALTEFVAKAYYPAGWDTLAARKAACWVRAERKRLARLESVL